MLITKFSYDDRGYVKVLTDKETPAWENHNVWIQIVRIRSLQPIKVDNSRTSGGLRQDFQVGLGLVVCTNLTANDENRAIGEHSSCRIPAWDL